MLGMLFGAHSPVDYVVDMLWISGNDDRPSIRDKWAATCVVRRDAEP